MLAAATTDGLSPWSIWLMLGSAVGAFLMRGAGCTWNDITDREIDAEVARTRSRPIPSGQVSVRQAVVWMGLQSIAVASFKPEHLRARVQRYTQPRNNGV